MSTTTPNTVQTHNINMREPNGYKSSISVLKLDNGSVDLIFSRSSQGKILVRLPKFAAEELSSALASVQS